MSSERDAIPGSELLKTEITLLKKDLEDKTITLDEMFNLIEDKDKEIEKQRLLLGELELKIEDLKKKPSEQLAKLQAEYDLKCEEVKELRAIEGQRTKEHDFAPASKVSSPSHVWVAACNSFGFYKELKDATMKATNTNDPLDRWRKVLFDVANDGQLSNARLEEKEG